MDEGTGTTGDAVAPRPLAPDAPGANTALVARVADLVDFASEASRAALLEVVRVAAGAQAAALWSRDDLSAEVGDTPPGTVRIPLPVAGAVVAAAVGSHPSTLELLGAQPRSVDLELVRFCSTLIAAQAYAATVAECDRRERRHRAAVDDVVSAAHLHRDVDDVLAVAIEALRAGMLVQGVGIRAFDLPGSSSLKRYAATYPPEAEVLLTDEILEISGRAARLCWEQQTASHLHVDHPDVEPLTTAAERDLMFSFMRHIGARELLMAPLGSAAECEGWLTLTRFDDQEAFDDEDVAVVMSIGREVGRVIRHARDFERQRELITQLEAVSDHKSRFTATLAHQLKNPLTSIQGHVEMLEDVLEESGEQAPTTVVAGSVAAIERGARRMAHITGSMLDLARLEQPERPLRPTTVDLDRVVRECADVAAAAADAGGVTIDTSGVEQVSVRGAVDELDMVVDNLLSNAVKYSPEGSTVRLGVRPAQRPVRDGEPRPTMGRAFGWEAPGALLWCADEGMGMSEEDVERLFDAFHRADDARQRHIQGTGLGMAILALAVNRHGGAVHVESEVGAGTCIEVWLPLDPPVDGSDTQD